MLPQDTERVYEYRKCIECFLCQDVCHVLRNHDDKSMYYGPRYMVRIAALEMHPLDTQRRTGLLHGKAGVEMCNITKCCQEVCPEHIKITDNAIIPLKERTATDAYDPIAWMLRKVRPRREPAGITGTETSELGGVRMPQRFAVKDVVRLKSGGRPFARAIFCPPASWSGRSAIILPSSARSDARQGRGSKPRSWRITSGPPCV